jgi:hypothetical protein
LRSSWRAVNFVHHRRAIAKTKEPKGLKKGKLPGAGILLLKTLVEAYLLH